MGGQGWVLEQTKRTIHEMPNRHLGAGSLWAAQGARFPTQGEHHISKENCHQRTLTEMKLAWHSLAIALASSVLPQPAQQRGGEGAAAGEGRQQAERSLGAPTLKRSDAQCHTAQACQGFHAATQRAGHLAPCCERKPATWRLSVP